MPGARTFLHRARWPQSLRAQQRPSGRLAEGNKGGKEDEVKGDGGGPLPAPPADHPLLSTSVSPISELWVNWISMICLFSFTMMSMLALSSEPLMATLNPLGVTPPDSSPLQSRLSSFQLPLSCPAACVTALCTSTVPLSVAQRMVCRT